VISADKQPNALYALQGVLIWARALANDPNRSSELISLLDYAEHLPRLIARKSDETVAFRAILEQVAERYKCAFVLQRFDETVPCEW
jgi:hypothetical protein